MNKSWHQIYFNLFKTPHRTKLKQIIIIILYEHSPRLNIYYFTFKKTYKELNTNPNPNPNIYPKRTLKPNIIIICL